MEGYEHKKIEEKWQDRWRKEKIYETLNEAEEENKYLLTEFPYPSGNLHVGHWYAFAVFDIYVRFQRMKGYNVMHPIGFDAFGLPAENAAIKRNLNPRDWTNKNIEYMRGQLESMGSSFDWSREVVTTDPNYYRWTQWLFLKFFEKGLAYQKETQVNWCPSCKTVLANEQVVSGECERCGHEVEKRKMSGWNLKITDYAERLLEDLEELDWPEEIKKAQESWIGKSEGAEIEFQVKDKKEKIKVFTTRPDTLYGATYLVISPEHEVVRKLKADIENGDEVESYLEKSSKKSDLERQEAKEKSGVELKGIKAVHPATKEDIPIWIADYVLSDVGTGAIMAVPAHDQRDFEFAKKFGLEIRKVVAEKVGDRHEEGVFRKVSVGIIENDSGDILIQSQEINNKKYYCLPGGGVDEGESFEVAALREVEEETGFYDFKKPKEVGIVESNYFHKIKEIYRQGLAVGFVLKLNSEKQKDLNLTDSENKASIKNSWVSKKEAQRLLQSDESISAEDFVLFRKYLEKETAFTGGGILINSGEFNGLESGKAREEITKKYGKKKVTYRLRDWTVSRQRYWGCPIPIIHCQGCGAVAVPEEDLPVTLPDIEDFKPTGEGKSPLAKSDEFVNTKCPKCGKDAKRETDTLDTFVDSSWYYLRYTDPGNTKEFASKKEQENWMPVDFYSGGAEHTTMHLLYSRFFYKALYDMSLVTEKEPYKKRMNRGLILGPDGAKMSKSKGNVIDPDEVVERLGADTVRSYLSFIGPYNEVGHYPWDPDGVVGVRRFLEKVTKISGKVKKDSVQDESLFKDLHKTIKSVGDDLNKLKLNTGLARLMEFLNLMQKKESVSKEIFEMFLLLLAPYSPHLTEELWEKIGNDFSIHQERWPEYEEKYLEEKSIRLAVQVNGKVRAEIEVPSDTDRKEVEKKALDAVSKWVLEKEIKRIIYVEGSLINVVL